jgi:hypothetical protein
MNRVSLTALGPIALALARAPPVLADNIPPASWQGENDWDVVYMAPRSKDSGECFMPQARPDPDHALEWVRDGQMMGLRLLSKVKPVKTWHPRSRIDAVESQLVVSVDGQIIFQDGVMFAWDPRPGLQVIADVHFVAWDRNNSDNPRPNTDTLLGHLKHGYKLTVTAYGQTYTDDLRGISTTIDTLFWKCFQHREAVLYGEAE